MDFIAEHYRYDHNILISLIETNGYLGAAKIMSEKVGSNIDNTFIAGVLYVLGLRQTSISHKELLTQYPHLFSKSVLTFILEHYNELEAYKDNTRDYGYKYTSVKEIAMNYLFKLNSKPVESIQSMYMRIAVQVGMPDNWQSLPREDRYKDVYATYDMLSLKHGIHATPTCVNAGYRTPQLESCFVVDIADEMISIADSHRLILMGSKCNGGFGIFVGRIRHSRVANRGITKGVPGVLKLFNTAMPYADQLGSRPGACTAQLPIWHRDVRTFIRMKDHNASPDIYCPHLNYAVTIPDLFQERVLTDGMWFLFCPRDTQILYAKLHNLDHLDGNVVDKCPSLCDMHGDEFNTFYMQCEQAGIAYETIKARELDMAISTSRCQTGEPFILYTDNVNRKSNQSHIGTVVQSNLCVAGETTILTTMGHIPINQCINVPTNVWNGFEWSTVTPVQTGTNQNLLTVKFSNGSSLDCTYYHRFYIIRSSGVVTLQADSLRVGDALIPCMYPLIDHIGYISIPTRVQALAQRIDHQGIINATSTTDADTIRYILQTLGCNPLYSHMGNTHYLVLSSQDVATLGTLGMDITYITPTYVATSCIVVTDIIYNSRIADTYCFTEPLRHSGIFNGVITSQCMEITQVTKPHELSPTCDLATINLVSLVPPTYSLCTTYNDAIKRINWGHLETTTRLLVRNLNRVLDRTSGIVPHEGQIMAMEMLQSDNETVRNTAKALLEHIKVDPTYTARQRNRAVGIGTMGLASMLSYIGIEYASTIARKVAATIRAAVYWYSMDESANLAHTSGPYPTFTGSPVSKGMIAPFQWKSEAQTMEKYIPYLQDDTSESKIERHDFPLIDPTVFGGTTWDNLATKCMKGTRNSLLTCQMPNVSTSSVFGVTPSVEPFYEIMYTASNINGSDQNIYDCFRDVMIHNDLYEPTLMAKYLLDNSGRVAGIHTIFTDISKRTKCRALEPLFTNSFSINKRKYILGIQQMAYYIDQAVSLNIFFDKPNAQYLSKLSRLAWINGCKTEYYLRRLATASNINAKAIATATKVDDSPVCKKDDPDCKWCS